MIRPQLTLSIHPELIVDNFAGGGGASTGIELALGRCVDVAINHDAEALALHAANHPQTRHLCEDVFAVDPVEVTGGQPVGLAWFSPDCKHFSKAKGGKPRSKKIRGLAWVAVKWSAKVRPRVILLENVEEFQTWGPLLADGAPCPKRKGKTFRNFVARLHNLGYRVEWRELRACDYGAPTIRKRLFLIARCDDAQIVWPAPTHGKPGSEGVRKKLLRPWRTAAECIDWSLPCPSIFERKRSLAEATLRRIARGIFKFVINSAEPFIVKFQTGSVGQEITTPLHTAMGGATRFGLCAPVLTECANASGQRVFAPAEPMRTQCAQVKGWHFALAAATLVQSGYGERAGQSPRALDLEKPLGTVVGGGQKHAAVAAFLAKHYSGEQLHASALESPVHTVTATDHNALVAAHLMVNTSGHSGGAADSPMPTVTTGNHIAEVRAFLIKYYGNEKDGVSPREPMHTVTSKDRVGVVTIHGEEFVITDIGMRMLEPHELFAAQGFPSDYRHSTLPDGRRLPKHAQVRMCGNSVCPPIAAALVAANVPELGAWEPGERKNGRAA